MGKIFKALEKSNALKDKDNKKTADTESSQTIQPKKVHSDEIEGQTHIANPNSFQDQAFILDPNLISALNPMSTESEQFRNLKNNILFPEKGIPPRSIMVTSTAPSEGKSFVSANLAVSIAQNIDEYVLLMDCDLRSPTINTLLGMETAFGLSDYLLGQKQLSSCIQSTFLDKLKVLSAGQIPENPSELLSSEQMRRLLHEVKLRYSDRYIIIDTPPPYVTSETSALARQVDGIVLVVRQGKTRRQDVHDIIDIYGRDKMLGVVYNDAKKALGYGYGKYGYGKYGYGKR